jgi:nicotinamidase-related amidase
MYRVLVYLLLLFPLLLSATETPQTLLQMAGAGRAPAKLSESVLVIIDAQKEYRDGALPLVGISAAVDASAKLLARARKAGTPVVHVKHRGGGALFNPAGPFFDIVEPLQPVTGETVIEKRLPNAFAGTNLQQVLESSGRRQLIMIGFMTHMCLSTTVRAALDLGYATTVVGSATATRDLPDGNGGTVSAAEVQQASLAALADRFAVVVSRGSDISE